MVSIDDLRKQLQRIKWWGVPQMSEHLRIPLDEALDELATLRAWHDAAVPVMQAVIDRGVLGDGLSRVTRVCHFCHHVGAFQAEVQHADTCPVTLARRLLESEGA